MIHGRVIETNGSLTEHVLSLDDHIAVELEGELFVHEVLLLSLQEAATGVSLTGNVAFLTESGLKDLGSVVDHRELFPQLMLTLPQSFQLACSRNTTRLGVLILKTMAQAPVENLGGVGEQISKDAELVKGDVTVTVGIALVKELVDSLLLEVNPSDDEGVVHFLGGDALVVVDIELLEDRLDLLEVDDTVAGVVDGASLGVWEGGHIDGLGGCGNLGESLLSNVCLEYIELGQLLELVAVLERLPLLGRLLKEYDKVDGEGHCVAFFKALLAKDELDLLGHVGDVIGLEVEVKLEVLLHALDVGAAANRERHLSNGG